MASTENLISGMSDNDLELELMDDDVDTHGDFDSTDSLASSASTRRPRRPSVPIPRLDLNKVPKEESDNPVAASIPEEPAHPPTEHAQWSEEFPEAGGVSEEDYHSHSDEEEEKLTRPSYSAPSLSCSRRRQVAALLFLGVVVAVIVVIALRVSVEGQDDPQPSVDWPTVFLSLPSNTTAADNFKQLTAYPSLAGTYGGYQLAKYVANKFLEYGIPNVEIREYKVLLAYPHREAASLQSNHPLSSSDFQPTDLYLAAFSSDSLLPHNQPDNRYSTSSASSSSICSFTSSSPRACTVPDKYQYVPNSTVLSLVYPASAAFNASLVEPVVPEDTTSSDTDLVPTFTAYGKSADITAEVFFVNYGRKEDFDALAAKGVQMAGKIAIARYGSNFRGIKAMTGSRLYNISGLIIYSDPIDDGYGSTANPRAVYPNGPYRPAFSVQRGSVQYLSLYPGDPLTPGTAAVPDLPDAQRMFTKDNAPNLPEIPVVPIGYGDAAPILQALKGDKVDSSWQGGLNFDYHLGVTNSSSSDAVRVRIQTKMDFELTSIWDVIGSIPGHVDASDPATAYWSPQEVLLGNHRDAWTFGGVDPHAGTAALLEIARSFGSMVKQGWAPRRTIRLCSWDAEEYALIGSTEYAEDRAAELTQNAVVYLNVDAAIAGETKFAAMASPSLGDVIRSAALDVKSARILGGSVYEAWQRAQNTSGKPAVEPMGSGSDFTPFLQHLGIASADVRFHSSEYGVYHSNYDSYYWMRNFGDPTEELTVILAKVWGLLAVRISESHILPYNFGEYADHLLAYWNQLSQQVAAKVASGQLSGAPLQALNSSLNTIRNAISQFDDAAADLQIAINRVERLSESEPSLSNVKLFNDIVMYAERKFLLDQGLPNRPVNWFKHLIYAPALYGGYAAAVFPGPTEAVAALDWTTATAQSDLLSAVIGNVTRHLSSWR